MNSFINLRLRLSNKSGIIIIVALWILVILSVLAVSLGRKTSLNLALSRYVTEKKQATLLSWSGIIYAMDQIKIAEDHPEALTTRTLYQSGYYLPESTTPQDLFHNVDLGTGVFDIGYFFKDFPDQQAEYCYGIEDENSRLNLNAVNSGNYDVLKNLVVLLGFDLEVGITIASSLVDWIDDDSEVTNPPYGAENDYYQSLAHPYACKNAPLESVAEMLLIRGVEQDILKALEDYVTVFPKNPNRLEINVNTAPAIVLKAVLRAVAQANPNYAQTDADSIVQKIIDYRYGPRGRPCVTHDRKIDVRQPSDLWLNQSELPIFAAAVSRGFFADSGRYLRLTSTGLPLNSYVKSRIQAVVDPQELTILFWKKN